MRLTFEDKLLIKEVWKILSKLLLLFLAAKLTNGLALHLFVFYGLRAALANRTGLAIGCYIIIPLIVVMNPILVPLGSSFTTLRLGFIAMTLLLAFSSSQRKGQHNVPIGLLWAYLAVSCISSLTGYNPMISYLKLVNFASFLIGLSLGLRNLHQRPRDIEFIRKMFLAISAIVILGSAATLLSPGIAYYSSVSRVIYTEGLGAASDVINSGMTMGLLSGITSHSQTLSTLLACTAAWVLCDMLFIERRKSTPHLVMLVTSIPLLYLTRSRGALLSSVVAVGTIYSFCFHYLPVSPAVKNVMRRALTGMIVLVAILAAILEVKDRSISRWVRKTDDVAGDERSLSEAFTQSRSGLVEMNLRDFRRNPLFGSGFQVTEGYQALKGQTKLLLSAPIEKGVLPLMILGESGIAGALVFLTFVAVFYGTCLQKRYIVTATLFTVLMTSNLGEATFFSTGGAGGIIWIMSMVGGFTIDMVVLCRRKQERQLRQPFIFPQQFRRY